MRKDLSCALRNMARNPGVFAVAVLTLALGIGANTSMFSVIHAVLLRPLPFREPDRLVTIFAGIPHLNISGAFVEYNTYGDWWRDRSRSFESMAAYTPVSVSLTAGDQPQRVLMFRVSASYLSVIGTSPALGRDFLPEEDRPGSPRVAIISDGLWKRRFGAVVLGAAGVGIGNEFSHGTVVIPFTARFVEVTPMAAWMRRYALAGVFVPSLVLAQTAADTGGATPAQTTPVTVQAGAAFHIALEKQVRVKIAGVAVEGRVVEPIYIFDRMAIPAGTQVLGRVSSIEPLSRKRRALAIANGDFTPPRKAHVDFDTLVLKDGTRLPLHTSVSEGVPNVVHLTAGGTGKKKKGRVRGAVEQAEQKAKDQVHQTVEQVTAPGKWKRLKAAIAAELPYHRQWLTAGTQYTAELTASLEVANPEPPPAVPDALAQLGREIPPGSVVHVSLTTPLSSATEHLGSPVRATVSEPLFSADHHLILPAGARLEGSVTKVVPARRLHRNGQLRFAFRQVELGPGAPRQVEASLQGVDAAAGANMKLDEEGGAHAVTPKTNLILPAIDVVLALGSLDGLDPHRKLHPDFHQGPDTAGGAVRGGAGFGLIGSVIGLAAHYRPVSACFAFYGAGWSVYTHLMARGSDVVFLKNTPMEIRFGTHESSAPAPNKMLPSESAGAGSSL